MEMIFDLSENYTSEELVQGLCFIGGRLHERWLVSTSEFMRFEWREVASFETREDADRAL